MSEFRGRPYINIREYYEDHGVEKPGKKGREGMSCKQQLYLIVYLGISLAADQWEKLKSLIGQVDKDLKKSK